MTDQNEYVRKWKLWTPYDVQTLRDLWTARNSASVIAEELTRTTGRYFTRNAVIGKINRLGLQGQGQPATRWVSSKKCKPRKPKAVHAIEQPTNSDGWEEVIAYGESGYDPHGDDYPVIEDDITLPVSGRVTLSDIGPGVCKYPIGDPLAADFTFCGDACDVVRPYCETHHKIAYVSITKQKKVAWRAYR